jgi:uncharacterized transporter YbjL
MALDCKVVSAFAIGAVAHVTAEVAVAMGSRLAGKTVAAIEEAHRARVLARLHASGTDSLARPETVVNAGDTLVVNAPADSIAEIAAAGRGRA